MHNSPETFFESLNPFGMALGLTRMRHLLRALDNPHSALRVLQVAGTNGKATERLHFHFSLSCIGEGNGNPLQCSCLEIPGTGEPGGLPSLGSHRVGHD